MPIHSGDHRVSEELGLRGAHYSIRRGKGPPWRCIFWVLYHKTEETQIAHAKEWEWKEGGEHVVEGLMTSQSVLSHSLVYHYLAPTDSKKKKKKEVQVSKGNPSESLGYWWKIQKPGLYPRPIEPKSLEMRPWILHLQLVADLWWL